MKRFLSCLIILTALAAKAQVYNNEWIDHTKTYYKFKVGRTGLFRISQATLATAGLGNAPAEHLQLWRNGAEVPIYTTVNSGALSTNDFIEFWGEMNDGKPDKNLYRDTRWQLNDKWSLETDSATYFLTINPSATNRRLATVANNVTGNTLPAEPYFMHTTGMYFRDKINNGYAISVGEYLYSSSYDKGEGWTSNDIGSNGSHAFTFNNLFVAASGPDPKMKVAVSGNALFQRFSRTNVNGETVLNQQCDFFNYALDSATFPLARIASNTAAVQVTNVCNENPCPGNDRMVIHQYEMTYPRQFNFGGASNFEFKLPASTVGNYLEIAGFTHGNAAPVLYDLTNGLRYVADISNPAMVRIVLAPSAVARQFVLVNQTATNLNAINTLQARNFINYLQAGNQADYIILSNALLMSGPNNAVEEYRAYRAGSAGGGFNSRIYEVDELTDQFGFGIKKHPIAIRNFLMYTRHKFTTTPKHVFIIGKGVNYQTQRYSEANPDMNRLNLVPTFGWPASDILLTANPGNSLPEMSIGRLSVVNTTEISDYLKKIKEFETAQTSLSPNRQDKEWMKNVVHINGISEPDLKPELDAHFIKYKNIISDTLFGAKVTTFAKSTASTVEQISSSQLQNLFKEGISLMTYFGHSSASTLEFNLENPESYQNQGKYPMFLALGCKVGDFFNFNSRRFTGTETITEKYVLAPNRGTIGFVASTHFGIVHYLDIWNTNAYKTIATSGYGKSIGEIMKITSKSVFDFTTQEDFYSRANIEELLLHGDPAVKINPHAKPDYVVDESLVKVAPDFISIAENAFKVNSKFVNIGKAVNKNIVVEVKRQYPSQVTEVVFRDTIAGIRYADSISISLPIDPSKDKGLHKLTITIDADNDVDELFESNNSITKEVFIYEDEIRPVYPYNFSIVNKQNIKLAASTANAFNAISEYRMELDTTELFNSSLKVTRTVRSMGGLLEFEPGLSFINNTVYYWRVGQITSTGATKWNIASFIYLTNQEPGFNQSHLYQHLKSDNNTITLDSSTGKWKFGLRTHNLFARNSMFPTGSTQEGDYTLAVDGNAYIRSACVGRSLIFNVFDKNNFKPWKNVDANGNNLFLYGSGSANCRPSRNNNFEFSYMTPESRKNMMDFMDVIPVGSFVSVRSVDYSPENSYSKTWRGDTALYGSGNSLYHKLLQAGFTEVDSIDRPRSWILIYQKGVDGFEPKYAYSQGIYDKITVNVDCLVPDVSGFVTSPVFGPSKAWKQFQWQGQTMDQVAGDEAKANIIGISSTGVIDTLFKGISVSEQQIDISSINASRYPYLQLHMSNADTVSRTPFQLNYWRLTYDPIPEGALAPNIYLSLKDTLAIGEPMDFKVAFKNVTEVAFDSLKVKMVITDANNVQHVLPVQRHRPLNGNDTLHVKADIDTRQLSGVNSLYFEVNPDNDQVEQYHFNNFAYRNFFVAGDTLSPLLDVTFDNVHILNNDIVSAKPDILIKLKDESTWGLLNDTALFKVQVRRYPNGTFKTYNFSSDTLRFTPAQSNAENTATINFNPFFTEDGTYEMMVSGKDKSNNKAGNVDYRVTFEVINKPMISNMLNYPNPFTTSTAFVFTITGSEVPQEFKIQILTVTGKVVKEITKAELGAIRIGRNITDYKWDGTDQYGQKLANGVYLYRVITSMNGKTLEKYKSQADNTDKFFNKGYGKMYLMR